jgi:hypothetical protein
VRFDIKSLRVLRNGGRGKDLEFRVNGFRVYGLRFWGQKNVHTFCASALRNQG